MFPVNIMKVISVVFSIAILAAVALAQADIHSVDFKNFTYPAYCLGEQTENITVKNGEYSREKQENGYVDRFWFQITSVTYGDLTGDGLDEAIALSNCNRGGTGNFSEGFVYGMRAGRPALLAHIPGGDRAYGGLKAARAENGLLAVESYDAGETGAACCPELVLTTHYRITGGKLVKVGLVGSRPVVPTHRVTFEKGTSASTFNVKIAAGESVRYVVGARADQTMSVSVNSSKVSVQLREEADVKEGINGFTVKLPGTGDFTTELSNTSAEDVEVTVRIRIT